jgi:hypothetical protein
VLGKGRHSEVRGRDESFKPVSLGNMRPGEAEGGTGLDPPLREAGGEPRVLIYGRGCSGEVAGGNKALGSASGRFVSLLL